jgi:hypothetical protein
MYEIKFDSQTCYPFKPGGIWALLVEEFSIVILWLKQNSDLIRNKIPRKNDPKELREAICSIL